MAEKQSQIWVYEDTKPTIKSIQRSMSASRNRDLSIADVIRELVDEHTRSTPVDYPVRKSN